MLPRLLFPLGALTKDEVRDRARALQLATAEKPESQEICFVPSGNYRDLLERKLPEPHPALQPGPIVRMDGTVVGEHTGYAGFTIGQRRGLGGGFTEPLFVLEVRPESREVVVGTHDELGRDRVRVGELNWLEERPEPGDRLAIQMRHRAPAVPATVADVDDTALTVELDTPYPAVTPGQSAVAFEGARVLGGGRIVEAWVTAAIR